jgi:hypothetical protein
MFIKKDNSYLTKKLLKYLFKNPINVLFYVKNLIFNNYNTPKEIRLFQCFICKENFVFPLTSKDYTLCNKCWRSLND